MVEHYAGVSIAYDSQVTMGDAKDELAYSKVFASGQLVVAVCGNLRMANQLRYADLPQPADEDWDLDRWIALTFIPGIEEALPGRDAESEDGIGGGLLVAVRGRVYELSNDLAWKRYSSGIYATGSGWQFALGALASGAPLREAVEIAARYDVNTGGRVWVKQASEILEDQE